MDETAYRDLISGKRRGAIASLKRCGLACLSPFYRLAVAARNRAFDLRLKRSHRVAVPVVSIGNITTGGTGKTPLVAYVANWFLERDLQPAILSRGYRSLDDQASRAASARGGDDSSDRLDGLTPRRSPANDEKLVLDNLCPGVPHVQNPDRVAGAKLAIEQHGAQVLILDDGFQHRRLARDLDIVLIDATNPFGYGRLLPRGLLREPLSALKRAGLVVLTRVDQVSDDEKRTIIATVRRYAKECPIMETAFRQDGLIDGADGARPVHFEELRGQPVVAFCGIGNPEAFRRTLADCDLKAFREFPDHHHFVASEIDEIAELATEQNATAILTTLKDLVKIERDELNGIPLRAVGITVDIISGTDALSWQLSYIAVLSRIRLSATRS